MDEGKFDGLAIREALTPKLTRAEMARKLGASWTFVEALETGRIKWPEARKTRFLEICAEWAANPTPRPKKRRKDIGKRHRGYKLRGPRKPRVWRPKSAAAVVVQGVPVPVPHSHGEVVGIG